jgi:hypothetical protein
MLHIIGIIINKGFKGVVLFKAVLRVALYYTCLNIVGK